MFLKEFRGTEARGARTPWSEPCVGSMESFFPQLFSTSTNEQVEAGERKKTHPVSGQKGGKGNKEGEGNEDHEQSKAIRGKTDKVSTGEAQNSQLSGPWHSTGRPLPPKGRAGDHGGKEAESEL